MHGVVKSDFTTAELSIKPSSFIQYLPESSRAQRWKKRMLSQAFKRPLDRVNVLGDSSTGHTGCVNTLSWARGGELLLTGGDDTTVRIWRMKTGDVEQQYPFVCQTIIHTGHRGNIFNAHMLPYSSRIATVAGDKQIRVFDVGNDIRPSPEIDDGMEQACILTLKCHRHRVKRIVTEQSPDLFLTVAEDGSVRQHDLRSRHTCGQGTCPAPLIKVQHELSTLALSPLTPYQIVVAGDSPYGYLFDRRHAGRFLHEEWGIVPSATNDDLTMCVRRFGRPPPAPDERRTRHITGARISVNNGHEVLLSYSADAVYLFSTRDEPQAKQSSYGPSLLLQNSKRKSKISREIPPPSASHEFSDPEMGSDETPSWGGINSYPDGDTDLDEDASNIAAYAAGHNLNNDQGDGVNNRVFPKVPVILPRRRFRGACNVETVKDVNFLGSEEEYVTSGSDDGHFFVWRKTDGVLHGVYEGDSSVVNVIESHPHLPLVAVSGIDTTVKLFSPVYGLSAFSRMDHAQSIIERNLRQSRMRRIGFDLLIANWSWLPIH